MKKSSLMIKLGRVEISVFSIVCAMCLLAADFSVCTLFFVCAVVVHEMSHILCIRYYGVKIQKINVYPFGIDILADMGKLSYKAELLCVLSGCASNLCVGAISFALFKKYPSKELLFFVFANLLLGFGNLVPLSCFDGGRAVKIIIESTFLPNTAYRLWRVFSLLSPLVFCLFSIGIILFTKCNFSLVIGVAYAALCSIIADNSGGMLKTD